MKEKLAQVFNEMEKLWKMPQSNAAETTKDAIDRIIKGETLVFVYPFAAPKVVDEIMEQSGAVGQFDLGLYMPSMLHVKKATKVTDVV